MNRHRIFVSTIASLAFLVIPSALLSYDSSPSKLIVLPEVIWAPATGGGTWVTELQITAVTPGISVFAWFYYNGGSRVINNLWTSPGANSSIRFSNILSTLQSRDSGFTYYGRVGSMILVAQPESCRIQAQTRTVNGNFGKTLPGLSLEPPGNSATLGRDMMIQDLTQGAAYRTFVGVANTGPDVTVLFTIFNASGTELGSFTKTVPIGWMISFNPFIEAGLGSGSYENCWLYIKPTAGIPAVGGGLFCFGSLANNYTNDTAALMAVQFQ